MSIQEKLEGFVANTSSQPYKIHEYAFIDTDMISFTEEVRNACKANYCGRYGKCWTCPPGAGDWQELCGHYKEYKRAFVYTTLHVLEDSFDIEGMEEGRKLHDSDDEALLSLLENEPLHELLGVGGCTLCKKCTYPDSPCRFPDRARRSMEACGIDVVTLARDCGIHYMNGTDTVTYFSVIFYRK